MELDQELGSEDLGLVRTVRRMMLGSQAACSWAVACQPYRSGVQRPKGESDRLEGCHIR